MIDLFDLSAEAGNKMATRDGSPGRRNQLDPKEPVDVASAHVDVISVANNMKRRSSSKKPGGTPMKMLIAHEMAKETESNKKTTSVVARLMGLDDDLLPPRKPILPSSRRFSGSNLSTTLATVNNHMPFEKYTSFGESVEYKDVYEVGYQPPRTDHFSNESSQKGRSHEDHDKRRMDLVREKFVEAKRLASDEKLLQSKEFHDALEVLSSNKDLFLKFLEEPNSLFSKQAAEFHSAPTSPQRRRITVLKPSKSVEMKDEKAIRRQQNQTVHGSGSERSILHRKSNSGHAKAERVPQHTRIVVLKPSSAITPVEQFEQNDHYDSLGDSEAAIGSRHLGDEINWPVTDIRHQRDESLRSCVPSNVFSREESYLNRSEYVYVEEEGSSFSDSEIETPTSRHSWDYIYRFSSPYFSSSLSRASCSPESLVTREAKQHTSQRWALASSNEIGQEKVPVQRSLSTLGEMLAMPDVKKEVVGDGVLTDTSNWSCSNEQRISAQSTCSVGKSEGDEESSSRKISRSKSVPVSSQAFENLHLDVGSSDHQNKEYTMPKEDAKPKNGKTSLKGKISSFFSSRRKKAGKEKLSPSPLVGLNDRVPSAGNEVAVNSDVSRSVSTSLRDDFAAQNLEEKFENAPTVVPVNEPEPPTSSKLGWMLLQSPVSLEKALSFEIQNSHFDQPSPTSVLDAPFEDANEKSPNSSESASGSKQEPLSRSLLIGSVARALSWDDSIPEAPFWKTKAASHEQEHYQFIEKLLLSAGFRKEKTNSIFVRWHSLDHPLNLALLNRFLERKVENAKCRERRSNQRLLFDCANAALLEIGQSKLWGAYPCSEPHAQKIASSNVLVIDEVWRLVRNWFFSDEKPMICETGNATLVADRVVCREIEGQGWTESLRLEVDEISKEICGEVLNELVGEALSGFAVGCL